MDYKNKRYNTSSTTTRKEREHDDESQKQQQQRKIICRCCLLEDKDEMTYVALDAPTTTMGLNENEAYKCSNSSSSNYDESSSTPTLLIDLLNICTKIDATLRDAAMPKHICLDCYKALENCYDFISCVQNADQILRAKFMKPSDTIVKGKNILDVIGNKRSRKIITTDGDIVHIRYNDTFDDKNSVNNVTTANTSSVNKSQLLRNAKENGNLNTDQQSKAYSTTTITTTDIEMSDNNNYNVMKSFDSGIEMVDDDLISLSKSNESNTKNISIEAYEGVKYVIPHAIADDLKHFHDNLNDIYGKYKCGFCLFQSHTQEKLESHLEKHLGSPHYKCHLCTFTCHFHHILKSHKQNVHNLSEAEIADDSANPHRIKYRCNICNLYLINLASLQEHIKMHEAIFYQCTMCALKNSKREIIVEHMAKEHRVYIDQKVMAQYIPEKTITYNNNTNASAVIAGTESIKNSAPKETATLELQKPLKTHTEDRKHLCQFCGKPFERKIHLLKHEFMQHKKDFNMDAYKNKILNKSSFSKQHQQHKRHHHHQQQQQYYLDQDSAESTQMDDDCSDYMESCSSSSCKIAKHHEESHKKFQCNQCSAEFLFNSELKYHVLTHRNNVEKLCSLAADDDNATPLNTTLPVNLLATPSTSPTPFLSFSPPFDINHSPMSSTASPLSSLSNFDIHDGQLYLNEFDLDLFNY